MNKIHPVELLKTQTQREFVQLILHYTIPRTVETDHTSNTLTFSK